MKRRELLAAGLALSPLMAALTGCGKKGDWPEGMSPIVWDREVCTRCRMVISDRRFAAELKGSDDHRQLFKFDDIGCAVFWMRDQKQAHPWMTSPTARLWVADVNNRAEFSRWLDARSVQYITKTSPMGYNFGAVPHPQGGSVDFATMSEHTLARGR